MCLCRKWWIKPGFIASIDFCLPEYAGNIGDAKDPEAKEQEQDRILQLVDKFWNHWQKP